MTSGKAEAAKQRFYAKVLIPDENGCMFFIGSLTLKGYGHFTINSKYIAAHRFSYRHWIGKIANKMQVLHKCDNRACVAPDHLFLGSITDNMIDMYSKAGAIDHKVLMLIYLN